MKTLIIYATKYGCSEKCAKLLKEKLLGDVELIDVKSKDTVSLESYDKVIIGGPIYVGMMNKGIVEFCNTNLQTLKNKKIGLFVCSMFGGKQGEDNMKKAFPEDIMNSAITIQLFGGELNKSKMKFVDRIITHLVSKAPVTEGNIVHTGILTDNISKFANLMND